MEVAKLSRPKVFISYSWTSPTFQNGVKKLAERLLADGVDVVLDLFDLKEGQDKNAYMEKMVTDPTVSHVLMFCDKRYAEKANARRAGVGTESQIISNEVYKKVDQSKFIPVFCELGEDGQPYLPVFLESRIGIDFSTPEKTNENWEQLIRALYGKPKHVKPELGKLPAFLLEEGTPATPAIAKFSSLRQAIVSASPTIDLHRRDFLEACLEYVDALRVRKQPDLEKLGEQVLLDCGKLKLARNQIIDWVLLEAEVAPSEKFQQALIGFFERLLETKARPPELTAFNEAWFEAHALFVYETFLYTVAALLKVGALAVLHEVFTSSYVQPETASHYKGEFAGFDCFYAHSSVLQAVLAPPNQRLHSPAAELIKRQADRTDLPFEAVKEADLLAFLMACITPSIARWYPQTLLYGSRKPYPFFLRAQQHKGFAKLATVTGIASADALRAAIIEGQKRLGVERWETFWMFDVSFAESMNLAKLDTLK
jgi:hypothetical protein